MLARISTIQGDPSKIDDGIAIINEKVIPTIKGVDGFVSATFLADRTSGKFVAIALWTSQSALEGSVQVINPIRTAVADVVNGEIVSVESFEVVAEA